ncbi:hypothetical protein GCM10017752_34320 [Streptomyces roseoviridis]
MRGIATHFTHHGIPARISFTAIALTSSPKGSPARRAPTPSMLGARTGRTGASRPPLFPDPPPKGSVPGRDRRRRERGQASGGENTTITRRSSVMWWNLCGTPAGT